MYLSQVLQLALTPTHIRLTPGVNHYIHILLRALEQFYTDTYDIAVVCSENSVLHAVDICTVG